PLLLYGAFESGLGTFSYATVASVLSGLALILIFVVTALRRAQPLIDLRLFTSRRFTSATVMTGLTGINMYAGLLLIPLYLQLVLDQSVAETGMWLLVMGIGSALALPLAGAMTDRIGAEWPMVTGALLLLVST